MDTLAQLRKKIDTLDDDIITLLAKRFSLVMDIGVYKKEHRLPSLDMVRRAQLLKTNIYKGKRKGLSEHLITTIREAIHKESLHLQ